MKFNRIVAIFLLVNLPLALYAQGSTVQLPREIKRVLNRKYPNWKLSIASSDVQDFFKSKNIAFRPNFAWGDFDGDGREDYAVQIKYHTSSRSMQLAIAFLRRATGYKEHVLKIGEIDPKIYIWLFKKGEKDFDIENEKEFYYKNDAVGVFYYEVAGRTYVYEEGKFRAVQTSD